MKKSILEKYAHLLVHYSLFLKPGEKLFVRTTTLAEPLVKELPMEYAVEMNRLIQLQMEGSVG